LTQSARFGHARYLVVGCRHRDVWVQTRGRGSNQVRRNRSPRWHIRILSLQVGDSLLHSLDEVRVCRPEIRASGVVRLVRCGCALEVEGGRGAPMEVLWLRPILANQL